MVNPQDEAPTGTPEAPLGGEGYLPTTPPNLAFQAPFPGSCDGWREAREAYMADLARDYEENYR